MDLIEDETHFLVDCEFYSDIRFNLFQSTQIINDRFKNYESIDKLVWLMNCNDLQLKLANILSKMNKRRVLASKNLLLIFRVINNIVNIKTFCLYFRYMYEYFSCKITLYNAYTF